MEKTTVVTSIIMLMVFSVFAQEKILDWVQETDEAKWKARDSQGDVVYKNQLWILGK